MRETRPLRPKRNLVLEAVGEDEGGNQDDEVPDLGIVKKSWSRRVPQLSL